MANIKVTYFNGIGLGEAIRWLLKYGNIDFEDVRIELDDWLAFKPTTQFGHLPMYEENGKVVSQSLAIFRYLGKKVQLSGANEWEDLEIDAIADTFSDLKVKLVAVVFGDPEKKASAMSEWRSQTMPYYFEKFDKRVAENDGYLGVKKLTWVDFFFVSLLENFQLRTGGEDLIQDYKNLSALRQKVYEIPAIKAWREIRPPADF